MYLYDTRESTNEIRRFPIHGWFFPCINCSKIIGTRKKILYKKRRFLRSKFLEVPCCKKCKLDEQFNFDKEKIHKVN